MDTRTSRELTVDVEAPADEVWDALVTPETIEKYVFGAKVDSEVVER